jgi:hypothetical protein
MSPNLLGVRMVHVPALLVVIATASALGATVGVAWNALVSLRDPVPWAIIAACVMVIAYLASAFRPRRPPT